MAEAEPEYYATDSRVFWDMDDFPVPEGRDLCSFYWQVKRALRVEGYVGNLSTYAYVGDTIIKERAHFDRARIMIVSETVEKRERLNKMLLDMLAWAYQEPRKNETNLIVVAKDIPEEETELFSVMKALTERGYNVHSVVPDDLPLRQVPPPDTADLVWRWTDLFDGKFPILNFDTDSESDRQEGSCSQGAEKRQKTTDDASHHK